MARATAPHSTHGALEHARRPRLRVCEVGQVVVPPICNRARLARPSYPPQDCCTLAAQMPEPSPPSPSPPSPSAAPPPPPPAAPEASSVPLAGPVCVTPPSQAQRSLQKREYDPWEDPTVPCGSSPLGGRCRGEACPFVCCATEDEMEEGWTPGPPLRRKLSGGAGTSGAGEAHHEPISARLRARPPRPTGFYKK